MDDEIARGYILLAPRFLDVFIACKSTYGDLDFSVVEEESSVSA
jgi:hypothetical protein